MRVKSFLKLAQKLLSKVLRNKLFNQGLKFIKIIESNINKFDFVILDNYYIVPNFKMIKENSKKISNTKMESKKSTNYINA